MRGSSLIASALLFANTDAWGPDGHTIVAHVAQKLLAPAVDVKFELDLMNVSLNNASDWNDDYDHSPDGRWSAGLHFINMPDGVCKFDWKRDCADDYCNAGAIVNYTRQVGDKTLSLDRRFFALKFVIHMMGDLHQPLHVSHASDRGGNEINLPGYHFSADSKNWSHHKTNLHSVWDGKMLVQAIDDLRPTASSKGLGYVPTYHDWGVLSDIIEAHFDADWSANRSAWVAGLADVKNETALRAALAEFADESADLACNVAYRGLDGTKVKSGDVLDRAYYLRAQPIIVKQLAKGGARLAALLSGALADLSEGGYSTEASSSIIV